MSKAHYNIIALDDQEFFLEEFMLEVEDKDVCLKTYSGIDEFEESVSCNDIKKTDLIIVDYDFGRKNYTAVDKGLVEYLKSEYDYGGKVILCSLHEEFGSEEEKILKDFDGVLPKRLFSWENLLPYLS